MFYDFTNCNCCKKNFCYICKGLVLNPQKNHLIISGHRKPTCKKHLKQFNLIWG